LIVAFSGSKENLESLLAKVEYGSRFALVLAAAATKPEFVVLGLLPTIYRNEAVRLKFHFLNRRDGFFALREMELRYSTRIDLLRSDAFHWKTLRPRAELIDWSLLVAEIALIRNEVFRSKTRRENRFSSPSYFVQSLAREFVTMESR